MGSRNLTFFGLLFIIFAIALLSISGQARIPKNGDVEIRPFAKSSNTLSAQNIIKPDEMLQYVAGGHVLGFRPGEVVIASAEHALKVEFVNAQQVSPIEESKRTIDKAYRAATPFEKVAYNNLWNGVTLVYERHSSGLAKSTYFIEPEGNGNFDSLNQIRLRYNAPISLDRSGNLVISFKNGNLKESRPIAWQDIEGKKIPVEVNYRLFENQYVSFETGIYNPRYSLVIDPVLIWDISTCTLSTKGDQVHRIAVDGSGFVYVAGTSEKSWGSPVNPYNGAKDAFFAKLDNGGNRLWNTFLGSSSDDDGYGIAVDTNGNVFVTGISQKTWGSPINPFADGSDVFVAKLGNNGNLQWNTFLGGNNSDIGFALALDPNGNIYVTGESLSTWGFPIDSYSGGSDAFVAKLNGNGILFWNTFLGSSSDDEGYGIAVDKSGQVYVGGEVMRPGVLQSMLTLETVMPL